MIGVYMGTPMVICIWGPLLGFEIEVGKRSRILTSKRHSGVGKRSTNWGRKAAPMRLESGVEIWVGNRISFVATPVEVQAGIDTDNGVKI